MLCACQPSNASSTTSNSCAWSSRQHVSAHKLPCLLHLGRESKVGDQRDLGLQVRERAAKAQPRVHQVKILRDAGEGPKSGKGKGFAFVELTEHEHALCALRQLNNNPVPFGEQASRPHTPVHTDATRPLSSLPPACCIIQADRRSENLSSG
jgi:hypothetical protein